MINLSNSSEEINMLLAPAIEKGCSIFLVDQEVAYKFLDTFTMVHDAATVRNPNKILILTDIDNELELEEILLYPSIQDIRNVFAILSVNESISLMKIYSTNWEEVFKWMKNETLSIESSDIFSTNKAYLNK